MQAKKDDEQEDDLEEDQFEVKHFQLDGELEVCQETGYISEDEDSEHPNQQKVTENELSKGGVQNSKDDSINSAEVENRKITKNNQPLPDIDGVDALSYFINDPYAYKQKEINEAVQALERQKSDPKMQISDNIQEEEPENIKLSLKEQWKHSVQDLKENPLKYLMIPIGAALVGYITNYVGVKMLFYPVNYFGTSWFRIPNQPLGFLGWQGVVPAKRLQMASTMVDVTITKLLSIPEVFSRLDPGQLAGMMTGTVKRSVLGGMIPNPLLRIFLKRASKGVIADIENIADIRTLAIQGLTENPATLGAFFQNIAHKELSFLINSGLGFGFILGLFQMVQLMLFPGNWTLPVGGAVVGYITNWIALKNIFEPINPIKLGPFTLQGMFLKRQFEVSEAFSDYISKFVLNSQRVWQSMLSGESAQRFQQVVSSKVPLPGGTISQVVGKLKSDMADVGSHPIHAYTDATLGLKQNLMDKMNGMTPLEFERVLHPIFQEDELTLIMAGAILGALAGGLQWWLNIFLAKRQKKKEEEKSKAQAQIDIILQVTDIDEGPQAASA